MKYFSIKLFFREFSSYVFFLIPWNKSPQSNVLISFLWWISSLHSCSLSCPWVSFLNPFCPLLTSCCPSVSTAALSKEKVAHREWILSSRYYGFILSSFPPLKSIPDLSNPENNNVYLRNMGKIIWHKTEWHTAVLTVIWGCGFAFFSYRGISCEFSNHRGTWIRE